MCITPQMHIMPSCNSDEDINDCEFIDMSEISTVVSRHTSALSELGVPESDCLLKNGLLGIEDIYAKSETQADGSVRFKISSEKYFSISEECVSQLKKSSEDFFSYILNNIEAAAAAEVAVAVDYEGTTDTFVVDRQCKGLSVKGRAYVTETNVAVLDLFSLIIKNFMFFGEGCISVPRTEYHKSRGYENS